MPASPLVARRIVTEGATTHRRVAGVTTTRPLTQQQVNRSVVAILVSVFTSAAAALAQATVLGKLVYDLTGRELDLGLLGLAEFAPAALLVLVTGSVADRFDRRYVAAAGLTGEAVVAGALAAYAGSQPTAVGPIFAMAFAFGTARAFAAPAARALPADTVPAERLPWLVARFSASWQLALVFGPVLGGFLYAADIRLPFVASALLLVISAITILLVRKRPAVETAGTPAERPLGVEEPVSETTEKTSFSSAVEGLRFIRQRPILLGA